MVDLGGLFEVLVHVGRPLGHFGVFFFAHQIVGRAGIFGCIYKGISLSHGGPWIGLSFGLAGLGLDHEVLIGAWGGLCGWFLHLLGHLDIFLGLLNLLVLALALMLVWHIFLIGLVEGGRVLQNEIGRYLGGLGRGLALVLGVRGLWVTWDGRWPGLGLVDGRPCVGHFLVFLLRI